MNELKSSSTQVEKGHIEWMSNKLGNERSSITFIATREPSMCILWCCQLV